MGVVDRDDQRANIDDEFNAFLGLPTSISPSRSSSG